MFSFSPFFVLFPALLYHDACTLHAVSCSLLISWHRMSLLRLGVIKQHRNWNSTSRNSDFLSAISNAVLHPHAISDLPKFKELSPAWHKAWFGEEPQYDQQAEQYRGYSLCKTGNTSVDLSCVELFNSIYSKQVHTRVFRRQPQGRYSENQCY